VRGREDRVRAFQLKQPLGLLVNGGVLAPVPLFDYLAAFLADEDMYCRERLEPAGSAVQAQLANELLP
jgi:hypothetical protein